MTQKLKFFLACLLILSLTACDEDDEPSTSAADLVGTWELQSFSFDVESVTSASGIETTIKASGATSTTDYVLEFAESTFMTSGSYSYNFSSEVSGIQTLQGNESISNVSGSGTYSTSGNEITTNGSLFDFTVDGMDISALAGEQKANYEIQSNGTLVISQNEETTTTTQGITVTSKIISTSNWVKQ